MEFGANSTCSNGIKTMLLNDQKAGMQGLDKEAINKIIFETSKGTPYFSYQEKRQQRIDRRVKEMLEELQKVNSAQRKESLEEMDSLCLSLEMERDLSHSIVHIDMDAFYAAVEMRDNPDLKSKPMAVGGSSMLSTSNYEARKFGVRAAMPGFIAMKLCPELIIVPCNFDKYKKVSKQIKAIVREYDPNSYAASLDEMYLDLTGYISNVHRKAKHAKCCELDDNFDCSQAMSSNNSNEENCTNPSSYTRCKLCDWSITASVRDELAYEIVNEIRKRILEATQLTASAGIAPNTMLAKVCSDQNKPNGQYQIHSDAEEVKRFIRTLPVKKVSGIGPVQNQLLNALDIHTCGDLYDKRDLVHLLFSPASTHFYMEVALGLGRTVVKSEYVRKSIGTEVTFAEIHKPEDLHQKCQDLCSELTEDLKARHLMGKVVVLKIKTVKFNVHTRNATLPCHTSDYDDIMNAAKRLLDGEIRAVAPAPLKLRLMGIRMSNLVDENEITDSKQAKLKNFLQPKTTTTSQGNAASSTSIPNERHICPICRNHLVLNLISFYMHVEECLQNCPQPISNNYSDGEESEVEDKAESSAQFIQTATKEEEQQPAVFCPVCGVEQESTELEDLNVHIDNCLSKNTIKEILAEDTAKEHVLKRKSSSECKNGKKSKVEHRTVKTIDNYFKKNENEFV